MDTLCSRAMAGIQRRALDSSHGVHVAELLVRGRPRTLLALDVVALYV